jgi:glycosyltransferase involved in cell wall biosynthesis
LKVAVVSSPFVSVPPRDYGGTELVIDELVKGLERDGHEVTLFATGDSQGRDLRFVYREPVWPPDVAAEEEHSRHAARSIAREGFDLVHGHVPSLVPLAPELGAPLVYTIHHDRDERLAALYASHPEVRYVAISARQAELHPELSCHVIHHGLDPDRYALGRGDGRYAAFLGRFVPAKGPLTAIAAAQAADTPLHLAGRVHEDEVTPEWLARFSAALQQPGVDDVGVVGGDRKARFLADARALLMPICWEEPFGLVVIEAMLCGTPVIAFGAGAIPEIVDEDVTGFVVRDEQEMAEVLRQLSRFDRAACRRHAQERFSAARMVGDYERVYASLAERARPAPAAETVPAK